MSRASKSVAAAENRGSRPPLPAAQTHGDAAAACRRRPPRCHVPLAGPGALPALPPPLSPLRHVSVTPPTLPLLLLRSFLPLHKSLRRRLVAGRMGQRPIRLHRRVWLRVRAFLCLPSAPPRLACAPRAIP
jgi:hypothetical protein